ncbi:hypothetical protein Noda2021_12490 [Candidatus Dependentiae bacterium Noda2021]|nr:hypothetical protein Noda2021_12490 [Candidatus Dependentiae bacterium Noda2021]
MKKCLIVLLCIAAIATKRIQANEIQPTQTFRLYAFKDDGSGNKYGATIPVYGAARKIVSPKQINNDGVIDFVDKIEELLFKRSESIHFFGTTGKTYTIQVGQTISCADGDEQMGSVLPCLDKKALDKVIVSLESAEYSLKPDAEVHEKLAVLYVMADYVKNGSNRFSLLFYGPENKFGVLSTSHIPDLYVKKPLNKSEFKELKEAFTNLYNHGINKTDLSAPIQAQPFDLSILKRIQRIIQ